MTLRKATPLFLLCLCLAASCSSQNEGVDRLPVVAGQFYPAQKDELRRTLAQLFADAVPSRGIENVEAVIVPHAGYQFSGVVAASGFNQIDPAKQYDNIFVLGPSHHVGFEGASVYAEGDYLTPLGRVRVNRKLAEKLVHDNAVFSARTDAHAQEHSVEVELPFLQYIMKSKVQVVPIVIGAFEPATCAKIAEGLRPYFNQNNLFVISTDLSHYPAYDDAVKADHATVGAVVSNSAANLIRTVAENARSNIPNLLTSMCGLSCVLTLLDLTEKDRQVSLQAIQYRNSGDASGSGRGGVVGYEAVVVSVSGTPKQTGFGLTPEEQKMLLALARTTIRGHLAGQNTPAPDPASLPSALKESGGAFVTLQEHGTLRGCIGRFDARDPIYQTVREMAIAASTQDYRFSPVTTAELADVEIEISVLSPLKKISSIDEITMGRDGIYIRKGSRSGTFLPQVAQETGWSREEFLGHCAQDKAGLGWDGWRDAEIYIYQALVFGEHELGRE